MVQAAEGAIGTVASGTSALVARDGKVVPAKDPMGRQVYWYTVAPVESTEETSDRWAFDNGYVSITPLRLELTDHQALERVRKLEAWKKLKFA